MSEYCVNKNPQSSGEHEVHKYNNGCQNFPDKDNQLYLGKFSSCNDALNIAKQYYADVDGCYFCCNECHTR